MLRRRGNPRCPHCPRRVPRCARAGPRRPCPSSWLSCPRVSPLRSALPQGEEFIYKTLGPPFPSRRPECHGRTTEPSTAAPWAPPYLSRRPTSAPRQRIALAPSVGPSRAVRTTHSLAPAESSPEPERSAPPMPAGAAPTFPLAQIAFV
jgi:hypothetical protein